jgi:hypothetical protein
MLWVFIYTVSYGMWNWKARNRQGGVAVIMLAVATVSLTFYVAFLIAD